MRFLCWLPKPRSHWNRRRRKWVSLVICSCFFWYQEVEVWIRCSALIINLPLASRAESNSKDILPKGIPFQKTEFSESKLCKVASPELQKIIPYLWRQVVFYLILHIWEFSRFYRFNIHFWKISWGRITNFPQPDVFLSICGYCNAN